MQNRVMSAMIACFGHDVRRINHALKVHAFAELIACREVDDPWTHEIVGIAALLHDIGIHEAEKKYNSPAGNFQEIEGPPIARKILSDLMVPEKSIDRVCFIIGNHHSYTKIDGIDFQILVEADLLVNSYEDEMKQDVVESVGEKVFRTETGKSLLKSMYLD